MGAWDGGVLWLGVRQWISSVLGVENSTLMAFRPGGEGGVQALEAPDIRLVGGGCNGEGEIVHIGDHQSPRDVHIERRDVY